MADPSERAFTPVEQKLQQDLKEVGFNDPSKLDRLAADTLGSESVKPEQFKAVYDATKPPEVPEWDQRRSAEALRTASAAVSDTADRYGTDAEQKAERLQGEAQRVDKAAVDAERKDTGKIVAGTAAAAATVAATALEKDGTSPEGQVAGAALRATAAVAATAQERGEREVEVVQPASAGSEDAIRNVGTINDSKIQARPAELEQRFLIKSRLGTDKYLNRETEQEAFRDTGSKIIVKPEARKLVAADVAKLADTKGWDKVAVTGSQSFRREVWQEANLRGIEVDGYKPTEQDKLALDKRLNSVAAAPRDNQGKAENKSIAPETASAGSPNPEAEKTADRREQLANAYTNEPRDKAVERYPELNQLYTLDKAATQFADASINDPKSREQFVASVRDRGLDELSRGNKLPELNVPALKPQLEKGLPGLGR